jgi:uncharacterized protein YecT (DUF1311 family)
MARLDVALALSLVAFPLMAQTSEERCLETAFTRAEVNGCVSDEVRRVEAELNDVYQKLLSTVSQDPAAVAKVRASEKAWMAYRDLYIEAMWPAQNKQIYGSMLLAKAMQLRTKLTRQHIDSVKELLDQLSKQNGR